MIMMIAEMAGSASVLCSVNLYCVGYTYINIDDVLCGTA